MKKRNKYKVKVVRRKLGREKAYGQAFLGEGLIEVDERLKNEMELKVLVHELLHLAFPKASETQVLKAEKIVGNTLWELGYRKTL